MLNTENLIMWQLLLWHSIFRSLFLVLFLFFSYKSALLSFHSRHFYLTVWKRGNANYIYQWVRSSVSHDCDSSHYAQCQDSASCPFCVRSEKSLFFVQNPGPLKI